MKSLTQLTVFGNRFRGEFPVRIIPSACQVQGSYRGLAGQDQNCFDELPEDCVQPPFAPDCNTTIVQDLSELQTTTGLQATPPSQTMRSQSTSTPHVLTLQTTSVSASQTTIGSTTFESQTMSTPSEFRTSLQTKTNQSTASESQSTSEVQTTLGTQTKESTNRNAQSDSPQTSSDDWLIFAILGAIVACVLVVVVIYCAFKQSASPEAADSAEMRSVTVAQNNTSDDSDPIYGKSSFSNLK